METVAPSEGLLQGLGEEISPDPYRLGKDGRPIWERDPVSAAEVRRRQEVISRLWHENDRARRTRAIWTGKPPETP